MTTGTPRRSRKHDSQQGPVHELTGCRALRDLPLAAIEQIAKFSRLVSTHRGQTLVEEGDRSCDVMMVTRGQLRLQLESIYPAIEVRLCRVEVGDIVGEGYFLTGRPCGTTICVSEPGMVLRIESDALKVFCDDHPVWGLAILRRLSEVVVIRQDELARRLVSRMRPGGH